MLAYYMSVFVVVATVLTTFRTDQPCFKFSPNRPWAISTDKILHTNEMLIWLNNQVDNIEEMLLNLGSILSSTTNNVRTFIIFIY